MEPVFALWSEFIQKRINYSFIPLGDCPPPYISVPYIHNHGIMNIHTHSTNLNWSTIMKNRTGIFLVLALVISFLAYGCTASASIGKQQNQKASTSTR
jgi:hypothetical protein